MSIIQKFSEYQKEEEFHQMPRIVKTISNFMNQY